MYLSDQGNLILSPGDLSEHFSCEHLSQLRLAVSRGELTEPEIGEGDFAPFLQKRGLAHEARFLESQRALGKQIVAISRHGETEAGLLRGEAETRAAMEAGAELIYQGTFFDGRWRAHADFLVKVEGTSDFGDWSYEVLDTKLALTVKSDATVQIGEYNRQLARVQGVEPQFMHIVLGDGTRESINPSESRELLTSTRERLEAGVIDGPTETSPEPVSHCTECPWKARCKQQWELTDHLSLVSGIRRDQREKLVAADVPTMAALASLQEGDAIPYLSSSSLIKLREQAKLQVLRRETGEMRYELLEVEDGRGLFALPPPSPGDLFFDMEGDPLVEDGGLEYLNGVVEIVDDEPVFHDFWGHGREGEKAAFERFVDFVMERREQDPNLHVYHYAAYEASAYKRLALRHESRIAEVTELLGLNDLPEYDDELSKKANEDIRKEAIQRNSVFVDLYPVVKQSMQIGTPSYSIKKLEPLYMPVERGGIKDAASSVVAYETWLDTGDQNLLDEIGDYNKDDCISTWLLRDWLISVKERHFPGVTRDRGIV